MSNYPKIIDKIYNANLPYFEEYKDLIYKIFLKSIQFHPLNRYYDNVFIDNLYVYEISSIYEGLVKSKVSSLSSIALFDSFPYEFNEDYDNVTGFMITDTFYRIYNTNIVFVGFWIHFFSKYCSRLNEIKNDFLMSTLIERKNLFKLKTFDISVLEDRKFYLDLNNNLQYNIESIYTLENMEDLFKDYIIPDYPDNIYVAEPKKQNIYGFNNYTDLNLENRNVDTENVLVLPYIASKVRNSIRYPDINYINEFGEYKSEILKSDIMTILKINGILEYYGVAQYKFDNNLNNRYQYLYPLSYHNPDLGLIQNINQNIADLEVDNKHVRNNLYIVKEKKDDFHYSIYYDSDNHLNYIVYEYDVPPIIEIYNSYLTPPLILRYPNYSFLILLYKVNVDDIINVSSNISTSEYNILQFQVNNTIVDRIWIMLYKPTKFKRIHNISLEIKRPLNNNTYQTFNLDFSFKAFETIIPFTMYNKNVLSFIRVNNLKTLTINNNNINDISRYILENINILRYLSDCDNTVADNLFYVLSNEFKWQIASTLNIWNFDDLPLKERIIFIL